MNPIIHRDMQALPPVIALHRHNRLAAKHAVAAACARDGIPTAPNVGNKFARKVARAQVKHSGFLAEMKGRALNRERQIIESVNPPVAKLPIQHVTLTNGKRYLPYPE